MPWRLRWAKQNLFRCEFWERLFYTFPQTPRFAIVLAILRILTTPTRIDSESVQSLLPELRGFGQIVIRNFSDFFIFWEIFIDRCYDPDLGYSPAVIVDIGANVGLFTLRMKQLFPDAQIFCFEPLPANYAMLARHIELCGLQHVTAYELGVSDTHAKVPIFIHPSNTGGHTILEQAAYENASSLMITVIPMDEVFELTQAAHIDLLKMDCEGAEKQIILSLSVADAERIERIVYEATASSYDPTEIANHLETLGYRLSFRAGLMWASRPGPRDAVRPDPPFMNA